MRRSAQAGFSLTEMLVALVILAAVTVSMAPAVRSAFLAYRGLGEAGQDAAAHRHLEQGLRELLDAAVQLPPGGNAGTFQGNEGRLSFVSRPPGSAAPLQVEIDIGGRSGAQSVTVRLSPLDGGTGASEVLADSLSEARFVFYGPASPDGPDRWYRDWEGPHPPRLVVLDMARRGGDNAIQRIEAGVGGQAGLACDYDSGLQACREGI